jgi:flagellar hook-associated protein 3 FlgL
MALETLSTQRRINDLSDEPIGFANSLKMSKRIGDLGQFDRNIEYTKGFLERSEAAIFNISDNLIRAKELAVAMSNDTNGPDSLEATAKEIAEVMKEVIMLGNSQFNDRFIFSGMRTETPTLNEDGEYLGDDGRILIPVDRQTYKPINVTGRDLFDVTQEQRAKGHMGMVESLKVLYDGLVNNDRDMIFRASDEIDYQIGKTTNFQASIGSITNSLASLQKNHELGRERMIEGRSKIVDADMFQATSDFKRTEAVLQSTLLASSKLLQPSLLNFMQ